MGNFGNYDIMYRCNRCKRLSQPGERANIFVVETRPAVYPSRQWANPHAQRSESAHDPGGRGCEIVKELVLCEACVSEATEAVIHLIRSRTAGLGTSNPAPEGSTPSANAP